MYNDRLRSRIIPTIPFKNGRRCDGYQYWCSGDVIPPTPPGPITCSEEIVLTQSFQYVPGPVDLGTVTENAYCPEITEGGLGLTSTVLDLGAL